MQGRPVVSEGAADAVAQADRLADGCIIAALRRGDEVAFASLIETHHLAMIRTALVYVSTPAIAEEVVQETWLEVFRGLARFEGRASLKTWIFRILTNIARTRGQQESRSVPFSDLASLEVDAEEPTVPPERFRASEPWQGGWLTAPREWADLPEERVLTGETRTRVAAAIDLLAPQQRAVITLRDVSGWSAEEVCAILGISAANQRVLLHRARAKVRSDLEAYFNPELFPSATHGA
jgi:RNA polymerase sigma-70 factor (ECF subfamily)